MKKIIQQIIFCLTMILVFQACSPSKQQIKASAKSLMAINTEIDSAYQVLNSSYDSYNPTSMDLALDNLNLILEQKSQFLELLDVFDDCLPLKGALEEKIAVMQHIAANESKEQVRIYKISDDDFNDNLRNEWDGYARSVEFQMQTINKKVSLTYELIIQDSENK